MNEILKIKVNSHSDIIQARMRVRRMARIAGLNTADQARIALATSSLAQTLRLGEKHQGEIEVTPLNDNAKRSGICVTCTLFTPESYEPTMKALKDTKWMLMVDDLNIEKLPSSDIKVTATKWA